LTEYGIGSPYYHAIDVLVGPVECVLLQMEISSRKTHTTRSTNFTMFENTLSFFNTDRIASIISVGHNLVQLRCNETLLNHIVLLVSIDFALGVF